MLRKREVWEVGPGLGARLQLLLLYAVGTISQRWNFRGTQRISWVLGRFLFNRDNSVVIAMVSGARLRIYLDDGYWTKLLFADYRYEPELEPVLETLMSLPGSVLLDCGANIGYWSATASGWTQEGLIVSVEASPPTFERLQENAALNGQRFQCRLGALWSESGYEVEIATHREFHAGASVMPAPRKHAAAGYQSHSVDAVTIDEISAGLPHHTRLVIKLDVENAELEALKGAEKALTHLGAVVIYEEHGRNESNGATEHLLSVLGMKVYYCDPLGLLTEIRSAADAGAVKTSPMRGYNFLACSNDAPLGPLLEEVRRHFTAATPKKGRPD